MRSDKVKIETTSRPIQIQEIVILTNSEKVDILILHQKRRPKQLPLPNLFLYFVCYNQKNTEKKKESYRYLSNAKKRLDNQQYMYDLGDNG